MNSKPTSSVGGKKGIFSHLYTWVLLAMVAGGLVGYLWPTPTSMFVTADGSLEKAAPVGESEVIGMSRVPTNVLGVIKAVRPKLEVDKFRVSQGSPAVYSVTFKKTIGPMLKPLGDAYIKLIKMVVAPIVFTTVVVGIAGMRSFKRVGRVGLKALIYFEVATTLALVIGWLVVKWIQPGANIHADPQTLDTKDIQQYAAQETHLKGVADFLLSVIPSSVVDAFSRGDIVQVLFFSVLFGFALAAMGERGKGLLNLLEQVAEALMKVIGFIVKLAPLAAFGAIAYTTATLGAAALQGQIRLMVCVYLTCFAFIVGFLGLVLKLNGISLWRYLKFIREELFIVLGTSSSESVLPRMMNRLEQLGCAQPVVRLVLPAGYSFNMDGSCIYLTMAAMFLAQATNTPLTLAQELTMIVLCLVTSKGAAGVTGGGFVALAATLSSLHTIPVAAMVLILGVDRLLSEARAITNLIGNGIATIVVSRWEGEFDEALAKRMLGERKG